MKSTQPQSIRSWQKEFEEFFSWCAPRLKEVMEAGGVRELWLQGEAYRYFRHHRPGGLLNVWTNTCNRNDLAFYADEDSESPYLVLEMKLYALNFLTKNLTGFSDMRPYQAPSQENARFTFTPRHRCHPREGSILKDYRKLLKQPGCMRLLMLVLNTATDVNEFGEAIQRVDFGTPGVDVFKKDHVHVRWWEIG